MKHRFTASIVQNCFMIDRRLHMLRMLQRHGTVTAAAEAMRYTPSAVSQQLRALAWELGVTLLVPEGRGVRLTPAAHVLLRGTDELFAAWERLQAEVQAAAADDLPTLRMCGFSTAAAALLPPAALALKRVHPAIDVQIIEAEPTECFDLLLAHEADLAVVVATLSIPSRLDARFEQQPLLEDPLDLLVSRDHRLADQATVAFSETATESWIADRPGRPYHQLFQAACAAAGFSPNIAHQAAEWDTAAALVAAGMGVALVPRLARLPEGYPVRRLPLRGDPAPRRHIITGVRSGSREQPLLREALHVLSEAAGSVLMPAAGRPSRPDQRGHR
jgi:DNA-binding transcriptional LysR family regulator